MWSLNSFGSVEDENIEASEVTISQVKPQVAVMKKLKEVQHKIVMIVLFSL